MTNSENDRISEKEIMPNSSYKWPISETVSASAEKTKTQLETSPCDIYVKWHLVASFGMLLIWFFIIIQMWFCKWEPNSATLGCLLGWKQVIWGPVQWFNGEDTCCQVWQSEFDPQNQHCRGRESAFAKLSSDFCVGAKVWMHVHKCTTVSCVNSCFQAMRWPSR